MSYLNYFENSYESCRHAFLSAAKKLDLPKITDSFWTGVNYKHTTDIVHLKNGTANPLVIITSGLHGIEGYVGSALQVFLLNQLKNHTIDISGVDLLLVHAINPWGFKHHRRVNQNNIDLNRNFDISDQLFKIKNEGYNKIRKILEPQQPYSRWTFQNVTFPIKILLYLAKYPKSTLIQAIGEGQYENNLGIIFGGKKFTEEKVNLEKTLKIICETYEKILIVDLHTGLGRRGKLQLLNAPSVPDKIKKKVNELFENKVVDDSDSNFFKEHGSFLDFVYKLNENKICLPVMFEFGTINSDSTFGAMLTLKNMINENQAYFYRCRTEKDKQYIAKTFLEMFYPSDPEWRIQIMQQFEKTLPILFHKFKNYN